MAVTDLYIVAIDEPQTNRLRVQYMPLQVQYQRNAKFDAISVIGRNEDLSHYSGGNTTISLNFDFYSTDPNGELAKQGVKFLESLQYSGRDRPPSRVQLVFGRLFENSLWLLQSLNVVYSVFEGGKDWLPRYAVAQCTFKLDTETDLYSDDVRRF